MLVDDGIEEPAIPPADGEVVTAHALVALHHALGPKQELLLGCHVIRLPIHLDVRDLQGTARTKVKRDANVYGGRSGE